MSAEAAFCPAHGRCTVPSESNPLDVGLCSLAQVPHACPRCARAPGGGSRPRTRLPVTVLPAVRWWYAQSDGGDEDSREDDTRASVCACASNLWIGLLQSTSVGDITALLKRARALGAAEVQGAWRALQAHLRDVRGADGVGAVWAGGADGGVW